MNSNCAFGSKQTCNIKLQATDFNFMSCLYNSSVFFGAVFLWAKSVKSRLIKI